jgi:hypothetical protein
MKTLRKTFVLLIVLLNYSFAIKSQMPIQQGFTSFQVFYDELSPYGQWVDYPNYGYVWIPNVGRDFFPYSTAGYWIMTEYGWTWISDYTWGWAPFHYGRWDYDDFYGWFWVPDNIWGPSWVTWRRANGYYGWTPMRPGIGVNLSFNGEYRDIDRWNFVRNRFFGRYDIDRHYINRRDNDMIIRNSTVINNTYIDNKRNVTYIAGPQGDEVQRITGRRINSVAVLDNDRPGAIMNNDQLRIYRPQVERINDRNQMPTPSRITNLKDVRPVGERNGTYQRTEVTPIENNRRQEQLVQSQEQIGRQRQEQQAQSREQRLQRQEQQAQSQEQIRHQRQEQQLKAEQQIERQNQKQLKQENQLMQRKEQPRQEVPRSFDNNRSGRQQNPAEHHEKNNGRNQGNRMGSRRR